MAEVNVGLALDFLSQVYGPTPKGFVNLFGVDHLTGQRHTAWAPVGDLESLKVSILDLGSRGDLWYGVAARDQILGHGQRGKASDCISISAFWLDVDVAGDGHRFVDLPKDYEAAADLVKRYQLPPDLVVHSGYGLQCYWRLMEAVDAVAATAALKQWATTWKAIAREQKVHLDNVFNLDRVMRVPGTWNWKGPQPVAVTMKARER